MLASCIVRKESEDAIYRSSGPISMFDPKRDSNDGGVGGDGIPCEALRAPSSPD